MRQFEPLTPEDVLNIIDKEKPEEYNQRVQTFITENSFQNNNMVIVDKGRSIEEKSAVLIENGVYKGYCFFDLNYQINNVEILKNLVIPMQHNRDIKTIIQNFVK